MKDENDIPEMSKKEQWEARRYLAINHQDGKCLIYGDDGELQCSNSSRHGRFIDFRREPFGDLIAIITATRFLEHSPQKNVKPCDIEYLFR
jgi:hypothetical protein